MYAAAPAGHQIFADLVLGRNMPSEGPSTNATLLEGSVGVAGGVVAFGARPPGCCDYTNVTFAASGSRVVRHAFAGAAGSPWPSAHPKRMTSVSAIGSRRRKAPG